MSWWSLPSGSSTTGCAQSKPSLARRSQRKLKKLYRKGRKGCAEVAMLRIWLRVLCVSFASPAVKLFSSGATDEISHDPQILADLRGRYGDGMGGGAARLRGGVVRRGLRHRCSDARRLGAGADQADQGRHQHHADAGANPALCGDDGDDLAGDVRPP